MNLVLPDDLLHPVGEDAGAAPEAWLYGVLTINGVDHHLEAIAVSEVDGVQTAEVPQLDESLGLYLEASSAERPFDAVAIGNRRYVLVLTPFSASTWRDAPRKP